MPHYFSGRVAVPGDDWFAMGHGLQEDESEAFHAAGHGEDGAVGVVPGELRIGDLAMEAHHFCHAQLCCESLQSWSTVPLPDNVVEQAGKLRAQLGQGSDHLSMPFVPLQRT